MDDSNFATIKRDFGRRLKSHRTAKGYSQEKLAEIAGLDRTYISSCERGHRNIGIENIARLANALGCELKEWVSFGKDCDE